MSQDYEITHLTRCIGSQFAECLATFRDTDFGEIPKECSAFSCSVNTLGHLFYAAVVLERVGQIMDRPSTIVEFGAGYGNLARIFKHFAPQATFVLIDLPELLALQYLFLRETLPGIDVQIEHNSCFTPRPGAIHLVPVQLLREVSIRADLFVSTFALSETPQAVQQIMIEKRFFDAPVAYITGQLHGAAPEHGWVHHSTLHEGLRRAYAATEIRPFHVFQNGVQLYSALCSNTLAADRTTSKPLEKRYGLSVEPRQSPSSVAEYMVAATQAITGNEIPVAIAHIRAALALEPHNPEIQTIHQRLSELAASRM